MPTISQKSTITAPGSIILLQGSQYEFAAGDGEVEIGMKADRDVTCSILSGPDTLAEAGSFVPKGASGEPPKVPDDYHWIDKVAKGDRIKIQVTDGAASGSTVLYWAVRYTYE